MKIPCEKGTRMERRQSEVTRRTAILGGGAAIAALPALGSENDPLLFLGPTGLIDIGHKTIADRARDLTAGATSPRERALAIFWFVSREIPFGFGRGFWDQKASDVIRIGRGYCNTKSTLFVALLRAAGIPARQVFVEIHATVLKGIINPGTEFVDHSYVEVHLDGAWVATDAYIADPALFAAAQARLAAKDEVLGLGIHVAGTCEWDGVGPAFSQYNLLDPRPIGRRHWGVFADTHDFYARAEATNNRLNPPMRAAFGLLAAEANRNAEALRSGLPR